MTKLIATGVDRINPEARVVVERNPSGDEYVCVRLSDDGVELLGVYKSRTGAIRCYQRTAQPTIAVAPEPSQEAIHLVNLWLEFACDNRLSEISEQSGVPLDDLYAAVRLRFWGSGQ
jgi:hypothetical protein